MKSLLIFLFMCPIQLYADTVTIRGGQHVEFTRLTIPLPERFSYDVGRTRSGYRVTVEGGELDFYLGEVFRRIGKDLIVSVTATENVLDINVVEGAFVRPSLTGANLLVLDFFSGADQPASLLPVIIPPDGLATSVFHLSGLSEHLFLRNFPVQKDADMAEDLSGIKVAISSGNIQTFTESINGLGPIGLSSRSNYPAVDAEALLVGNGAGACNDVEQFNIATRGFDDFSRQVGAARRALYAERDVLSRQAVIDMGSLLLISGFHQEALEVMALLRGDAETDAANFIVATLDGRAVGYTFLGCDSTASFWNIMNHGEIEDLEAAVDLMAVYRDLPAQVQGDLLEIFVEKLIDGNFIPLAESLIKIYGKNSKNWGAEVSVHEALATYDLGLDVLEQAVQRFDRAAMIKLLEFVREHGLKLDADIYELIETELFIESPTSQYNNLRDEFARASIDQDRPYELARLYSQGIRNVEVLEDVEVYLISRSPDSLFLTMLVSGQFVQSQRHNRLLIEQRAVSLGFGSILEGCSAC